MCSFVMGLVLCLSNIIVSCGVDVRAYVCNEIVISVHIALHDFWLFACNFE